MRLYRYSLLTLATAVMLLLPQTASAQSLSTADGLSEAGTPAAVVDGPIAPVLRNGGITITQNVNPDEVTSGGIRCANNDLGYTTENSFYRLFDLAEIAEITEGFAVSSATVGLDIAAFPNATPDQIASVRLYTVANPPSGGAIDVADLTEVGSAEFLITGFPGPKETGYIQEVEISAQFAADDLLLLEMFLPSGNPEDTGLEEPFNMSQGENDDGETAPVYLASASCGIVNPTEIGALVPDAVSGWVVTITGANMGGTSAEGDAVARTVTIGQNFPNPVVSGATRIPFSLESAQRVSVTLYDALGREVVNVADAAFSAGEQSVDVDTAALPNGVYFYRVATESQTLTQKMVVVQ